MKQFFIKWKYWLIIGIIVLILLINYYTNIANFFFLSSNNNPYGELLKVLITAIGGICVIYGLWLNNKRIGEQTRQNNLTDKSNNDKRFGEAVSYLNSDNVGIAIGGVYTLNQLALEDERYRKIVCNIFCQYLSRTTKDNYTKERYQVNKVIIDLLFRRFNSIVDSDDEDFDIENAYFVGVTIEDTKGVRFRYSVFEECSIECYELTIFEHSAILSSFISLYDHIGLGSSLIKDTVIESYKAHSSRITIEEGEIERVKILAEHEINKMLIRENRINDLYITAGLCMNGTLALKYKSDITINCPDVDNLLIRGDTSLVKIDKSSPYDV